MEFASLRVGEVVEGRDRGRPAHEPCDVIGERSDEPCGEGAISSPPHARLNPTAIPASHWPRLGLGRSQRQFCPLLHGLAGRRTLEPCAPVAARRVQTGSVCCGCVAVTVYHFRARGLLAVQQAPDDHGTYPGRHSTTLLLNQSLRLKL